jgi:hypothetical protein
MALTWYRKNQRCGTASGILQDLHDVMYMSINHGKIIDDMKEHGRVVMRESFHKHRLDYVWTNYLWTYYHQFGK